MPDSNDKTGGGAGQQSPTPALPPRKTLGFTIENIAAKLPDFGEDPLLLGWMFFFIKAKANPNSARERIENIADIRMKEVRLVTDGRRAYKMEMNDLSASDFKIKPLLHTQEETPVFLPNVTEETSDGPVIHVPNYDQCLGSTVSGYAPPTDIDGPEAPLIVNLEEYQAWADAAYIRATDLRLLKTYLVNDAAGYDDVFFSGAELDYSTLHNARLRLEQRYLKLDPDIVEDDTVNGGKKFKDGKTVGKISDPLAGFYYLDSSVGFTLKAEPIVMTESSGGSGSSGGNLSLTRGNASANDGYAVSGEMMPGAFTMVGCPKTWEIMQAIRNEAIVATNGTASSTFSVTATGDDDLDAMIADLNSTGLPANPASATWLAQLLRDIADAIDRLFGSN